MLVRRLARPMLAAIFISGGMDTLRNPGPKVPAAEDVAAKVSDAVPALSGTDTEQLIRINGGVQVAAGSLLALNRFPRLSALVLAATVVPTTAAGHRFWEIDDEAQRKQQLTHFLKNVGLLGGLLLAAVDTEGRPGVAWRTRHTAERAGRAVRRTRREAKVAAKGARREAKLAAGAARREAKLAGKAARAKLAA